MHFQSTYNAQIKKKQLVSYILLDSEQLLTFTHPPKYTSKYPNKFIEHPMEFKGLKMTLDNFFNQIKALQLPQVWNRNLHRVSVQVKGEIFLERCKRKNQGNFGCKCGCRLRWEGKGKKQIHLVISYLIIIHILFYLYEQQRLVCSKLT